MNQERVQRRTLTDAERARLRTLRDALWDNFDDEDACRPKHDRRLTLEEWVWLTDLATTTIMWAVVVQGLTTPNPFVLLFEVPTDRGSAEQLLMAHPFHVPSEFHGEDPLKLFRAFEESTNSTVRERAALSTRTPATT